MKNIFSQSPSSVCKKQASVQMVARCYVALCDRISFFFVFRMYFFGGAFFVLLFACFFFCIKCAHRECFKCNSCGAKATGNEMIKKIEMSAHTAAVEKCKNLKQTALHGRVYVFRRFRQAIPTELFAKLLSHCCCCNSQ